MSWRAWLSALSVTLAALSWSPAFAILPSEPEEWLTSQSKEPDQLTAARTAFERRDYFTASRLMQPLAQAGIAPAQVGLGRIYGVGLGVPRDDAEAIKWYRLAAEQGDPDGMNSLAYKYRYSDPPLQNTEQALVWFRRAADLEYPSALNNLGIIYLEGSLVPPDPVQAVELFRRAAVKGHAPAMHNVANMLMNAPTNPDFNAARALYLAAAERGHADAMASLGQMYDEGRGVP